MTIDMQKQYKIKAIKEVIRLLAEENYVGLFNLDKNKRIPSIYIEQAITEYGCKVTIPPNEEFEKFDSFAEKDNYVSIDSDLWVDGCKSDLTLSMTIEKENNDLRFSIDGIHVL